MYLSQKMIILNVKDVILKVDTKWLKTYLVDKNTLGFSYKFVAERDRQHVSKEKRKVSTKRHTIFLNRVGIMIEVDEQS